MSKKTTKYCYIMKNTIKNKFLGSGLYDFRTPKMWFGTKNFNSAINRVKDRKYCYSNYENYVIYIYEMNLETMKIELIEKIKMLDYIEKYLRKGEK